MSITLLQEFVSCNEACISWNISPYSISQNSKPVLCLSDINKSGVNVFSTVKYLIRSNEMYQGLHTFTGLQPGEYTAEIVIITGNSSEKSEPLPVIVYQVDTPVFQTNGVISGNKKFTISLEEPTYDMTDGTVTFILYGQSVLQGDTQNTFSGIINKVLPFALDNTYIVDNDDIQNNSEYEITCFYTNSVNISGLLSEARLKRPTNAPNQITELEAIYSASLQTLTITHNLPSNVTDYDLVDCRATITDALNNVTYYYSSENSANLDPAPTVASPIVFNMNNKNLLPVDVPFTVTLSAKNEVNLWGPEESPAINCIYTNNFSAVPVSVNDLTFSVGLNSISTTDKNTYAKNNVYDINYTASVYNSNANGDIVGSAVETKMQTNDLNFEFTNLVTGNLYKMIINLNYTYTFDDYTTVTIEQHIMDTCYKHFIPHDVSEQLTLSATPSDQNVVVSWLDITQEELNGFILDHYEVSDNNADWTNKNLLLSHNFTELTNGTPYTFYVRAVSNSGTTLYMSGENINGQTANITSIPYGNPSNLTKVSQLPENEKCTVVWTISAQDPYNGGLFNKFEASVNSGLYSTIVPSFANNQYTYEFAGLTNLATNNLLIRLVNNNQSNLNNVNTIKNSDSLSIVTTPYSLPDVPSNFQTSPDTTSVTLSWNAVTPASIIDNAVEYELYYKLHSDSEFTIVSNIATNSYNVTSLTSNSMYDFKVRSSIYNSEVNNTFYSNFSAILASRPFIHLNAPNMVLEAGNNTIKVKLTPNVSNYFQTTFKYYATVSNLDGTNSNTIGLYPITNSNQQTITFTVLGDNTGLVNLTQYKVESYYEMLNTDNNQYYSSNTVDNVIRPFNANLVPVLTSVSGNTVVDLTWDISAFDGYSINYYELSNDNVSWSTVANITQISSNILKNITGLTNGQSYDFYVRVVYEVNNETKTSSASNKVTNIPYTNASAPTNLNTVAESEQITLSWSQPSSLNGLSLDHYQVKIENNEWIDVENNLSYVFTGLTNGTSYTMYVRAVTLNVLEGNVYVYGASASNYNIPYTTASAPIFVSCVEGNQQLTFTWSVPSYLGGLSLASYDVKIDNGSWTNVETDISYLFTGLTNGQGYTLQVRANTTHPILGLKNGDTYTSSDFYPYTTASAPIFVSGVQGNQQLTFTWSAPSSLGGLPLASYEVSINNGDSWTDVETDLSYVFTGLTNGQGYSLQVRAVCTHPNLGLKNGAIYTSSDFYPSGNAIAPTFKYGSSFSYSHQTSNQFRYVFGINKLPGTFVNGNWEETVGANTGGLPVAHYEYSIDNVNWITMYNVRSLDNISINASDQPSSAGFYLSAPRLGETITVKARAVCTHPTLGLIPGSSYDRNVLVYVPPSGPVVSTNVAGNQSLTINWSSMVPYVTGTGANSAISTLGVMNGLPFDKFQVAVHNYGNGTDWRDVGSNTSYTFTGLTNGTSYTPIVRAIGYDQYANSPQYTQITTINGVISSFSSNTPYTPAVAPTLNAIVQQDSELRLTWNAPTLGGLSFVRYEMSVDGSSWTSSVGNPNYTASASTPSFLFTSLTNGQSYNLRVRAITNHPVLGEISGATFTSLEYVPYKVSSTPQVTITPSNRQNLLQWPASDLGGLSLNNYQISYNGGSTWTDLPSVSGYSATVSSSTLTISNLLNGTNYAYSIRCVTTHPNLGAINSTSFTVSATPFVKPGLVSNVVAAAINGSLNFSFTEPVDVNDNAITQNYEYSIDEAVNWNALYQLTSLTTSIGNNIFSLKIRAYIINPNDAARVNGNIYTLNNLQNVDIITPQNLASSFGNGSVTLSWDAVNSSGISYQVIQYFADGSTTKVLTNNNIYSFTGLTNGTAYKFGVALYTSGTAGPVSNITVTPMIAPVINSVTKSGDVLSVNVNFGGSSSVNVVLTASAVETINNKDYIPVEGGQETVSVDASSNPITFSGMSNKTRFNIVVSNTVGNTNGTYTI